MDPVDTQAADAAQPDAQSTPAAPAAAGPMAGAPAAAPAPAQQQPPAPPSPAAQVVAHQSRLGQIAMAAMGKQVSYQADPQTGVVTPVVQQRSFSDFARNLVGGLLLGGAIGAKAGAEAGGSPLAAGVAGAQGVNAQQQQQQQDARAQAVQQMKEQQDAAKSDQDLEESKDREALTKAQIAHSNLTTLQLNQAIQRQGYDDHDRLAQSGKANVQPYVDAGLKPIFEDIPESQMEQTIKNYPGAGSLDWTHTGMVTGSDLSKVTGLDVEQTGEHPVQGPDGQTHYESTFTAYDPKGEVPLSQQTLSQWKQDGFLQSLGANAQDVLKPDMQMPAQQYIALKNQHEKFQLQTEQTRQQTQKVAMDAAKLDVQKSLAAQHTASAAALNSKAHGTARTSRANQTDTALDAAGELPDGPAKVTPGDTGGDSVTRAATNVMGGYSTLDDVGRGMGTNATQFRRAVQDSILKQDPSYDFEGQKAESKEFNSIPVRTKMTANETLTGRDGKSGLLKDLSDAAHAANLTTIPSLNDVQAWTRIQSGSAAGVKAHQLATDVAEQYGSIFAQGGATSDAKIKLGQDNFPKNFNTAQTDEAVSAARVALGDRMRVYADHNRFIRAHYGAAIPVQIQDDKGNTGKTTMDQVDGLLAKNKNWKRLN